MSKDVVNAAQRAETIVASFAASPQGSVEVFETFAELDALSPDVVRQALAVWLGPLPDLERMDDATRLAQGLPLRPFRLSTLSVTKDADLLDLGPVVDEQLRLAGKSWDGRDLAAEERLDGEVEGSFAGTLERRVLADADAPVPHAVPLFDVFLFAQDSGIVFVAGTTRQAALIAYGRVEMLDKRVRHAIEEALASPVIVAPVMPTPAPALHTPPSADAEAASSLKKAPTRLAERAVAAVAPIEDAMVEDAMVEDVVVEDPAKKAPAKRAPAKKAPVKKAPAKKAPAKKAPAEKAPAKKAPAKKAPAKKTPVKKAPAKKAPAKKAPAKKAPVKKAPAKKTPAKKAPAKKAPAKKAPAKKAPAKKAPAKKASP